MSEQSNNTGASAQSPNRRNNNRRRHHNNRGPNPNQNKENAQSQNAQSAHPNNNNNKKRHPNNNANRAQRPQDNSTSSIERLYEKYLNLLDQHLIARRKYHDLFYRADPAQKIKLEKNFYNTVNEIREFENRMNPETRALFEKRNNGLSLDTIYATNHELPLVAQEVPSDIVIEDPHLLQSQINCDFKADQEESSGSIEDYLKYKGL